MDIWRYRREKINGRCKWSITINESKEADARDYYYKLLTVIPEKYKKVKNMAIEKVGEENVWSNLFNGRNHS